MAKLHVMLFISFLLFALVQVGSSLKCYNCTQATDFRCEDYFTKEVRKVDCPRGFICVKHTQPAITINADSPTPKKLTTTIIRGCKPRNYCRTVNQFSDFCQGCEHDYCNSSFAIVPAILPLVVTFVITYKLKIA